MLPMKYIYIEMTVLMYFAAIVQSIFAGYWSGEYTGLLTFWNQFDACRISYIWL